MITNVLYCHTQYESQCTNTNTKKVSKAPLYIITVYKIQTHRQER